MKITESFPTKNCAELKGHPSFRYEINELDRPEHIELRVFSTYISKERDTESSSYVDGEAITYTYAASLSAYVTSVDLSTVHRISLATTDDVVRVMLFSDKAEMSVLAGSSACLSFGEDPELYKDIKARWVEAMKNKKAEEKSS